MKSILSGLWAAVKVAAVALAAYLCPGAVTSALLNTDADE